MGTPLDVAFVALMPSKRSQNQASAITPERLGAWLCKYAKRNQHAKLYNKGSDLQKAFGGRFCRSLIPSVGWYAEVHIKKIASGFTR